MHTIVVGDRVGVRLGWSVGARLGHMVGREVGFLVGFGVGAGVGLTLGANVGRGVGGISVGAGVGSGVGSRVGGVEGTGLGLKDLVGAMVVSVEFLQMFLPMLQTLRRRNQPSPLHANAVRMALSSKCATKAAASMMMRCAQSLTGSIPKVQAAVGVLDWA